MRRHEPGEVAALRQSGALTPQGEQEVMKLLRKPSEFEISNSSQFNTGDRLQPIREGADAQNDRKVGRIGVFEVCGPKDTPVLNE